MLPIAHDRPLFRFDCRRWRRGQAASPAARASRRAGADVAAEILAAAVAAAAGRQHGDSLEARPCSPPLVFALPASSAPARRDTYQRDRGQRALARCRARPVELLRQRAYLSSRAPPRRRVQCHHQSADAYSRRRSPSGAKACCRALRPTLTRFASGLVALMMPRAAMIILSIAAAASISLDVAYDSWAPEHGCRFSYGVMPAISLRGGRMTPLITRFSRHIPHAHDELLGRDYSLSAQPRMFRDHASHALIMLPIGAASRRVSIDARRALLRLRSRPLRRFGAA